MRKTSSSLTSLKMRCKIVPSSVAGVTPSSIILTTPKQSDWISALLPPTLRTSSMPWRTAYASASWGENPLARKSVCEAITSPVWSRTIQPTPKPPRSRASAASTLIERVPSLGGPIWGS